MAGIKSLVKVFYRLYIKNQQGVERPRVSNHYVSAFPTQQIQNLRRRLESYKEYVVVKQYVQNQEGELFKVKDITIDRQLLYFFKKFNIRNYAPIIEKIENHERSLYQHLNKLNVGMKVVIDNYFHVITNIVMSREDDLIKTFKMEVKNNRNPDVVIIDLEDSIDKLFIEVYD